MTRAERLHEIESSLPPKDAVLLWLREMQQLPTHEFLARIAKDPMSAPRVRIPPMAQEAVWVNLGKQGTPLETIQRAALLARKQTDFLIVLVLNLNGQADRLCGTLAWRLHSLSQEFNWMLHQCAYHSQFTAKEWNRWRDSLVEALVPLLCFERTVEAVSKRYFDHNPVLFPPQKLCLALVVSVGNDLARWHWQLVGGRLGCKMTGIGALKSSIEAKVAAAVSEHVAYAKARALEAVGEWKAAAELRKPYMLADAEELRAAMRQQKGH